MSLPFWAGRPLRRAWLLYLLAGALATLLYAAVPPFAGNAPLMNLLGATGVLAAAFGTARNRPGATAPWWAFTAGLFLFWLGDIYTYSYPKLLGHEVPFPSIGDGIYLLMYPVLMAGLVLLLRRRNPEHDRGGSIDSTILTLGLALPSWVALIAPYLHDDTMSVLPKLVAVAYPLGDILLLAAAVRLALDSGRRQPAFYLLSAGIVGLLVTDWAYGLITLDGAYTHQLSLDVGWIAFYLLWGAAALHPSMRELDQPSPDREPKLTTLRLALLASASLIAPVIEFQREFRRGDLDLLVIIAASVVLFALVVARMAGLVRQQERSVARERVLTAAGAALVAATSREEIQRAALDATGRMLDGPATVVVCRRDDQGLCVVARGDDGEAGEHVRLSPAAAAALLSLAAGDRGAGDVEAAAALRAELSLPAAHDHVLCLAFLIRDETRGVMVVARPGRMPQPIEAALRALVTQVSLALESTSLTEQVHRRRSEARFASLVQHASDLITVVAADGTVTYQSPSIERVLGYRPEEILGRRFDELLPRHERGRVGRILADGAGAAAGEAEALECTLRHSDGSWRQLEVLQTNLLADEAVRGIVLNARDVSERKAFEEQLAHQAFHDPVTGLANRALFVERVRHAIARGRREDNGLAVLFLDLDDFKTINDSLGHAAGDELLRTVAERLASCVRASDTAARFGGDEFAVLLEGVEGVQEAADTAERLLEAIAQPVTLGGKQLVIRSSLGLSLVEAGDAGNADDLIRDADAAMYIAKRDGKGGYRLFEPAMHDGVLERLELRADLQRALTAGELELHYQPVVRLSDGSVAGVEALLRWRHPERGLVTPDQFIPLAEESGLIVPIGRWVLREACRQAVVMQRETDAQPPLAMSINLSVEQLQHSDVVADVQDALEETGLDPSLLTLEITESVLMTDTDVAIRRLEDLRGLGVRLAMDDFGTGYSSLSYLSRFPVDILKMDRSFLDSGAAPEASGLASAVVALGETLCLEVVAEGIEVGEQWTTLRDLGCALGQGYLFARPMDAAATLECLRDWSPQAVGEGHAPQP